MRRVYTVLAYVVAAEVVVQAMLMVYGIAGLGKWVTEGGVFDKAVMESEQSTFPEAIGIVLHGLNGGIVIPVVALLLVICSFFARVPAGRRWAGLVLLLVVIQVNLGYAGHDIPAVGAVHGLNALLLFTTALYAARRSRSAVAAAGVGARERVGTSG